MTAPDDLDVLRTAEKVADSIWRHVLAWDEFPRNVVGRQLIKAADSIGANIAESIGRYKFGEKLQFLYYARGSLFETKYWLNRSRERGLMENAQIQEHIQTLIALARQLNAFARGLKGVRDNTSPSVRESSAEYFVTTDGEPLFSEDDLHLLAL